MFMLGNPVFFECRVRNSLPAILFFLNGTLAALLKGQKIK